MSKAEKTGALYAELTGNTIYEQHDAAFRQVSAYAILKDGKPVAKVAFKFPADGAGRLYAYVHYLGLEMVRGYANGYGYGYDKRSAAVESAIEKMGKHDGVEDPNTNIHAFVRALTNIGGAYWHQSLENAGFTVFQVV